MTFVHSSTLDLRKYGVCRALKVASICRGWRSVSCIRRVLGIAGALSITSIGRVWKVSGIGGSWRVSGIGRSLSISSVHRSLLLRRRSGVSNRGSTSVLHWLLLDHRLRGVHWLLRNYAGSHTRREKVDLVDGTSPHMMVTAGVLNNRQNEYEADIWHKDKPIKPSERFDSPKFTTVDFLYIVERRIEVYVEAATTR